MPAGEVCETGEIMRHGPHHAAQKLTTTGIDALVSAANVPLVGIDQPGKLRLASWAARKACGDRANAIAYSTARTGDDGHFKSGERPTVAR
jgi:hypothetical protein